MSDFDPVCGCFGCTEPRVEIVDHPKHGRRAVCQQHLEELEVNGGV